MMIPNVQLLILLLSIKDYAAMQFILHVSSKAKVHASVMLPVYSFLPGAVRRESPKISDASNILSEIFDNNSNKKTVTRLGDTMAVQTHCFTMPSMHLNPTQEPL